MNVKYFVFILQNSLHIAHFYAIVLMCLCVLCCVA